MTKERGRGRPIGGKCSEEVREYWRAIQHQYREEQKLLNYTRKMFKNVGEHVK